MSENELKKKNDSYSIAGLIIFTLIVGIVAIIVTRKPEEKVNSESINSEEVYNSVEDIEPEEYNLTGDIDSNVAPMPTPEPEDPNSTVVQLTNQLHRELELVNNTVRKEYIYKDEIPFGTDAIIKYDSFYKKYTISFYQEDQSLRTSFKVTDESFKGNLDAWTFSLGKHKYRLTDYESR